MTSHGPWRRGPDAARYVLLSALALVFLLPFYVIVRNALATPAELASASWVWWPSNPSLDNLRRLFADENVRFARSMLNSAVVSVLQTVLTVAISAMAGYGLARVPSRASRLVLGLTVLTLMVPTTIVLWWRLTLCQLSQDLILLGHELLQSGRRWRWRNVLILTTTRSPSHLKKSHGCSITHLQA